MRLLEPKLATLTQPDDLLLAVDVLRGQRRHRDALRLLDRVIHSAPTSEDAGTARFIKGRLLLGPLGKPCAATRTFAAVDQAKARRSMVEDALALEVEAWSKCGRDEIATERAHEFLRRFPKSHQSTSVRRAGRLPAP